MIPPRKPVGLGFGLLGTTNTAPISDAQAEAIFAAAREHGITRYDTAPLYGGGVSEERLGRLLRSIDRDSYILSTKVGRYRPYAARIENPVRNSGDWNDYGREATLRSVEQSLERLGTDRIDIVFVHDCDTHVAEALDGALPALFDLKGQGVIGAVGCGSNRAATHAALLDYIDLDVLMVAGRFTLLDQSAADGLFRTTLARSIDVELAAPFNSGILAAGADDPSTRLNYMSPDEVDRARVHAIARVCEAHGVTLKRAALHYSAAHPAVTGLILGLIHPEGLSSNLEDLRQPVPDALWPALEAIGIVNPTRKAIA
jgi:D-threo-aldose 1-dehydrogenase